MNLIEISERVRDHLTQQMDRSESERAAGCAYRGEEGRMCAVGCLIKDDFYTSDLEEKTVGDWGVMNAVLCSLGQPKDVDHSLEANRNLRAMLDRWQQYHDNRKPTGRASGGYADWIDCEPGAISPADFHERMVMLIETNSLKAYWESEL